MTELRENPPEAIDKTKVVAIADYQLGVKKDLISEDISKTGLPTSNVLQFFLEDGSKVSARPSGTEPKIKFYISVRSELTSKEEFERINQQLENRIDSMIEDLGLY